MKTYLCAFWAVLAVVCQSQTLQITNLKAGVFSLVLTNALPGRGYWFERSPDLLLWTNCGAFRGSPKLTFTNPPGRFCFWRAATAPMIVTNIYFGSFTPYPKATTNRPVLWKAYAVVTWADAVGGYGTPLSINGTNWVVYARLNNILQIRTEGLWDNPPRFAIGDEIRLR